MVLGVPELVLREFDGGLLDTAAREFSLKD
jgi:hypothetical protein